MAEDDLTGSLWHPSPNFSERRGITAPRLILLHYTAMQSAEAALERLCDPACDVSAHYLIAEDGRLWQMVREEDRAWHAGAGAWGACRDVNSASIGIELANAATHPFSERQMVALEVLLRGIMDRWTIPPEGVLGHSDTAIARKVDPGRRFDWLRLARQGLAVWPRHGQSGDFLLDAARFGYDTKNTTAEQVLHAFRLRFRPQARGPLDDEDRRLIHDLAQRYPANRTTA
ncbi:N-acetylmuramoyl-L-alanine amidase [Sagittula salina]|uniref:N-acetylmuramoyl-L-alanine amidase n=1 Tax=Sagittula salina TaxID=2820268 RepID=A0A940MK89_9RHOB|nr:N-acetylmuramoyl-L-alanine amidase [Sagittula salina]MBP0481138.1 N-acetylmuramoyl-L-alanine amidase [Sagittula salina]